MNLVSNSSVSSFTTFAAPREQLTRDGFETGPITTPVWLTGIWIGLFIIRPWEVLIPELGIIRFERLYALMVLGVVFASGRFRFQGSRQSYAVLLYLAALTISALFAYDPSLASTEHYKYLTLVVFYVVLLSVVRTPYQLCFIITCYIVAMALYLGKAEWEYFVHDRHGFTMGVRRLHGIDSTFAHPNSVAGSTVVSLPFLQFLWWHRRQLTESWPTLMRRWFPHFLIGYFLLAVSAIVLTNSRSGAVQLALFMLLFAKLHPQWHSRTKRAAFVMLTLAALWVVMPESNRGRISTLWNPDAGPANAKSSAEMRGESFWAGMAMFSQHPLAGVGIGNTAEYRSKIIDGVFLAPHNFYGEVLGETGIIGAAAFAFLIAALFANIRWTLRVSSFSSDPTTIIVSDIARACKYSVVLLLVSGLAGAGMLRYNWLWLAAFALLARNFCLSIAADDAHSSTSYYKEGSKVAC